MAQKVTRYPDTFLLLTYYVCGLSCQLRREEVGIAAAQALIADQNVAIRKAEYDRTRSLMLRTELAR